MPSPLDFDSDPVFERAEELTDRIARAINSLRAGDGEPASVAALAARSAQHLATALDSIHKRAQRGDFNA